MEKTTSLELEEIKEIRRLAREVAGNPELTSWIATFLWDIVKENKKNLSEKSIHVVQIAVEQQEKDIPTHIMDFLQRNILHNGRKKIRTERIMFFIDNIRKYILMKLQYEGDTLSAKAIEKYSQIFNMHYIIKSNISPKYSNDYRLAFAVALAQNDAGGVLDLNPELIDQFYSFYFSITEEQMKDLLNMIKYINNCSL